MDCFANHTNHLIKNLKSESGSYRSFRPWLIPEFLFKLTSKGRGYQKNLKVLHSFTKKVFNKRKQYYEKTGGKYLDSSISPNKNQKRLSFLNILLSAAERNEGVDDRGIQEEVDTFIFEFRVMILLE
ncbi:GSCOCT00014072001.2-RA-CDS [Cotesia congregata]|nr:GSCOCT00014072001.2-RA-CDS [Cotesia congregata]